MFSKVEVHSTKLEIELALEKKNGHMWMWHFHECYVPNKFKIYVWEQILNQEKKIKQLQMTSMMIQQSLKPLTSPKSEDTKCNVCFETKV